MDWIQQWQSKLNKQNGVAPLVRTGGSRHTGLAALPYRNIQRDNEGQIYDIVAGDFLVVGLGEEDFASLSPELMEKFEKEFHQPEMFVRMGRSIMALPLPDDKVKTADSPLKAESMPQKSSPDRDVL